LNTELGITLCRHGFIRQTKRIMRVVVRSDAILKKPSYANFFYPSIAICKPASTIPAGSRLQALHMALIFFARSARILSFPGTWAAMA
jgi:hypothetical protein